jgi:hypothetical protein
LAAENYGKCTQAGLNALGYEVSEAGSIVCGDFPDSEPEVMSSTPTHDGFIDQNSLLGVRQYHKQGERGSVRNYFAIYAPAS